ncbi:YbhB/YbcL family Raf kinase inhibitor-like protein [Microbulbifer harenosus]|nr:YbhB/YbcL family Raf kinase inhibitor-like protein [Microbulbifer harenosus]
MRRSIIKLTLSLSIFLSGTALAGTFTLDSKDISNGEFMPKQHEFQGFGCSGGNKSPQLSWSGAPEGTGAYALMVYDPDAPTGSGWWHWQLVNIPASVNNLDAGAGDPGKNLLPAGSINITNDYGAKGFGGACPPKGHGVHRYQFTLYALSKKLTLPEGASGALTGYMVKAHSLATAKIEALYERK